MGLSRLEQILRGDMFRSNGHELHGTGFQFGLQRGGASDRVGEGVGFGLVSPKSAPVHRDKDSARGDRPCHFCGEPCLTATRSHFHPVIILDA